MAGVTDFWYALGAPEAPEARGVAEDDGIRVGVAVPDVELLRDMAGGGPIAPSRERFAACVGALIPLVRALLTRAALVIVDGVSVDLRSLPVPTVSERADDGRDPPTLGVPKMEDSRR